MVVVDVEVVVVVVDVVVVVVVVVGRAIVEGAASSEGMPGPEHAAPSRTPAIARTAAADAGEPVAGDRCCNPKNPNDDGCLWSRG